MFYGDELFKRFMARSRLIEIYIAPMVASVGALFYYEFTEIS